MKLEETSEGIWHAIGNTAKELGMSFLRPQEHYESPKFRGKIFSFDEFREWWIRNPPKGIKPGRFIYCNYYEGFNVPSHILNPFFEGKFDPLSDEEKRLLEKVSKIDNEKFYLIGTRKNGSHEDIKHELGHGFYYTDPEYRKKVQAIMRKLDTESRKKIDKYLQDRDYHPSVFSDERQAYFLAGDNLKDAGIKLKEVLPVHLALNEVYQKVLFAKNNGGKK